MKNKDLQELKPVYIHEITNTSDDNISLIDLAIILIKRKILISVIFILFVILGITAALQVTQKFTYSTSIEIGSQVFSGSVQSFESPQTLLAKLEHSFIPQVLIEYQQHNPGSEKKYKIKASAPKESNIVILEIDGNEEQFEKINKLLHNVSQKVLLDHSRIYESVKVNLLTQIEVTENKLSNIKNGAENLAEKASLESSIKSSYAQLAMLNNTRVILPPMKSLEPIGSGRLIIVIIASVSGLFIGVFTAFFAEFAAKVKERNKCIDEIN